MKVLSLFDGISAGRLALERAGIRVSRYHASEVDKYAMQVSRKNYPDIIQLGDVTQWENWDLGEVDMLIGGSPCQGFSFAGKQLNFDDPRSALFFKYVEVLKYYKPKCFLFENVVMKKEYQAVISEMLGVEPIMINSSLLSAQSRKRLYWTNIPNITQPEDQGIMVKDILENSKLIDEKYTISEKLWAGHLRRKEEHLTKGNGFGYSLFNENSTHTNTLSARYYKDGSEILIDQSELKKRPRKLTPRECARLQTFPDSYTASVSNTQRYKMLGNSWTVDVIAHIFRGLCGS